MVGSGGSRARASEATASPGWRGRLVFLALAFMLMGFGSIERLFAPGAEPWPRWERHDPKATARVDHSVWNDWLGTYVSTGPDGIARVAYGRVVAADRTRLDGYIGALAAVSVSSLDRTEQRAFWVNLYNALTVAVVLEHYPVGSIRDINLSRGLFARGPWDRSLISVEGEALSLNDIEHRILRPGWRDPRIHYALNCAALGCPNLLPHAFTSANTDRLLEQAARAYVNHPRGLTVRSGVVRLSSIYVWFAEDFGGKEGVLTHLLHYADQPLRSALDHAVAAGADYAWDYDWRLNEAR